MVIEPREVRMAKRKVLAAKKTQWLEDERRAYRDRLQHDFNSMPGIRDTFKGQSVFITGATGVMGKALVEKLLRSCPDIKQMFLLVRKRHGMTGWQRMQKIFDQDLFDKMKAEQPNALDKVRIIHGDTTVLGLGLSDVDRETLHEEINFVFHGAASVNFNDALQDAVIRNMRGTREVVELAKGMQHLKAFIHISTTYCNTDQEPIGEVVYPSPVDYRAVIKLAEAEDKQTVDNVSMKLMGFQPNTYTFTKKLAEDIVNDARGTIPAMICRPSVVAGPAKDPVPGWTDNLYGPLGICMGVLKGVLRFQYGDPAIELDYVPADVAIRGLIVAAWILATKQKLNPDPSEMDVVNMTISEVLHFQYYDLMQMREPVIRLSPLSGALRYPRYTLTKCWWYYRIGFFFSHFLFALVVDSWLRLAGQKPRLMKVYRQVYHANHALLYFMLNNFSTRSEYFYKSMVMMHPKDQEDFDLILEADEDEYIVGVCRTIEKYKFKNTCDFDKNRKLYKKLHAFEVFQWILIAVTILWMNSSYSLHARLLSKATDIGGALLSF